MMIEEYKETVLHELEEATNEDKVEQIINRSIEQFPEMDLYRHLVVIYLHILQNELVHLSEENVDSFKRVIIRHALNYLRKMNKNREKGEE